jgi:hypothetical protein
VPPADRPDLLLDARLVRATVVVALLCAPVAAALGGLADGRAGALGALWAVGAVGANGALAAAVSARGGRTSRQIAVGWVVGLLPVRLVLLGIALAVATGPLGLPAWPVVLAACGTELCVIVVQSVVVLRGPTFVGPL